MKNAPPISRFMFLAPIVIDREAPIEEAKEKMERYQIRHLPIVDGEKVVGVVSSRDLDVAWALQQRTGPLTVGMIVHDHVFTVEANEPVDKVLWTMAHYKYGCAIIVDKERKAIGIFTAIDAMKLLATLLQGDGETFDLRDIVWP